MEQNRDKKNLLLIMSRAPYPPYGGDKLKSFHLVKILNKHFRLHIVVVTSEKLDSGIENFLKENSASYRFFYKSKLSFIPNLVRSIFSKNPIQCEYYYFSDVQKYIDKIADKMDIIIPTLVRVALYVKDRKSVYLDMVDAISINYERSIKSVKSLFWKMIYKVEYKRLREFEIMCVKNFRCTFFVNRFESENFSKYGCTCWIPNGVDEALFEHNKIDGIYRNSVLFFGKMDYQPNVDAVFWIYENILPKIDKDIDFKIVGIRPNEAVRSLDKDSRVQVLGFVEDPYIILKSSLCVLSPMQSGGGIQNKVLESMAVGALNILSSIGAKPIIGAEDKKHFLIEDDVDKFVNLINDIYKNREKYESIKEDGKRFIEQSYTWDSYEKRLLEMLNKDNK